MFLDREVAEAQDLVLWVLDTLINTVTIIINSSSSSSSTFITITSTSTITIIITITITITIITESIIIIIISSSSSDSSSGSSSTQRVGLRTVGETHIFKRKTHQYIARHNIVEQPMFQKTHQKQETIKHTKLNKTMGTNSESTLHTKMPKTH